MSFPIHLAYAILKKAVAKINMGLKLDKTKGKAIVEACDDVLSGTMWIHFPLKLW
jgi:fumarate hydratase class II